MGHGIITRCSTCLQEEDFLFGVAMKYFSLDNVIGDIHWRNRKKIIQFRQDEVVANEEYEYRLFFCAKCHIPYSRFWVKLTAIDGTIFELAFRCPQCRSIMIRGKMDFSDYRCRSCGKKTLVKTGELAWD